MLQHIPNRLMIHVASTRPPPQHLYPPPPPLTKQRWRTLPGTPDGCDYADVGFVELDLGDASSLSNALAGCDLVVHTAGPFQRKTTPEVLEAAIEAKVRARAHYCRRVFGSCTW